MRTSPHRTDLLVGSLLGIETQLEAAFLDGSAAARWEVHGLVLVLAVAVALRRRFPFAGFLVAQAVFIALQSMDRSVTDSLYVPLFLVLLSTYSAAANTDGRRFWAIPPIAYACGVLAMSIDDYHEQVTEDLVWLGLVFVAGPVVVGRLVRNRSQLHRALQAKADRLERERHVRAEEAVAEERERIAAELHDIVAHALSEMVIQASAARRLAHRDEEAAAGAFVAIEGRGRDALDELRRLLGVLRHADTAGALGLAPQPSLRHLDGLARRARAAGLPVGVAVDGEALDLPAGIDVTAYRVVQQALTAALGTHGAGRADVHVRYGGSAVELEVTDDGHPAGGAGHREGLLGLHERVALYGGELFAAERRGGHVVRARLPVEAKA